MARVLKQPIPPREEYIDLTFPTGGIDLTQGFERQRGGTCVDALNVRGWDPVTGRNRGGSRPGLIKYIAGQVSGTHTIQDINALALSNSKLLLAVSNGNVAKASPGGSTWTVVTNGTAALSSSAVVVRSAVQNQAVWYADGVNYKFYGGLIAGVFQDQVSNWVASAGTLPASGAIKPTLIAAWRGRIILSGLTTDPSNIFMSAIGDPTDFDYAPAAPSSAQAFDIATGNFGQVGDIVTAIIPYTDDVLIIGTQHTIWMLQGDPGDGGKLQLISSAVGIANGQAWCMDPYGNIYFFANTGGVYALVPGQQPQRISQQIEQFLFSANPAAAIIRLGWDEFAQAVHIFNSPTTNAATSHFVWESRTNAWWLNQFANILHNPLCTLQFFGDTSADRGLLLGSWDGYVRTFSIESESQGAAEGTTGAPASTDDGTPISSVVFIGPLVTANLDELLVKDLQAILGTGSGDVTWQVQVGSSAQAAFQSSGPHATGTWSAGRNPTSFVRVAAHALYVEIRSANAWTLERIRCRLEGKGRIRMRRPAD